MEQKAKATNSIVEGVIWKSLLAFFFPILLGTFFQQMYNTVDSVVVGNFVGKEALAAVGGSAAQILNLLIGFFTGIGSGATVVVSQYYGADDADGVHRAVHTAIAVAVLGGLMMTVLGLLCAPTMLRWMDTPPETMEDSAVYLRVIFLGMIPSMIYNIGSGIQRAVGDSKRPLYFLIVCCVLNIALDLLFVVVFRMGVAGVAIATTLSQVVSAILVCASLGRTKDSYRLEMRRVRLDRCMTNETIRIGLPSGLQSVLFALSNILITTSINGFGTSTVAAWVALGKVDAMNWMIIGAFGVAVTTFVGQNYGARRYERVSRSMRVCMVLCEAATILFSILAVCFSRQIFSLFTQDGAGNVDSHDQLHGQMLLALHPHRNHQRHAARHGQRAGAHGHNGAGHLRHPRGVDAGCGAPLACAGIHHVQLSLLVDSDLAGLRRLLSEDAKAAAARSGVRKGRKYGSEASGGSAGPAAAGPV